MKFLINRFEECLASLLLLVMVSIAFANVVTRYFIKLSFSWTEELTVNLFVWVVLLGTAHAFRKGGHLGVSLVYEKLPVWGRRLAYFLFIFMALAFFGTLCYLGYVEVMDEMDLEVITESLAIPVWWYTIATPVFSGLIIVRILERAYKDLKQGNI